MECLDVVVVMFSWCCAVGVVWMTLLVRWGVVLAFWLWRCARVVLMLCKWC